MIHLCEANLTDCGHPSEWGCHDALGCLGLNLAVGGALCAAFSEGMSQAETWDRYHAHGYRGEELWRPGCGRKVPWT